MTTTYVTGLIIGLWWSSVRPNPNPKGYSPWIQKRRLDWAVVEEASSLLEACNYLLSEVQDERLVLLECSEEEGVATFQWQDLQPVQVQILGFQDLRGVSEKEITPSQLAQSICNEAQLDGQPRLFWPY